MTKIGDILSFLEQIAPYELQENFDNVGLLVGDKTHNVKGVLCALDITLDVLDEAINTNCNVIVAHHPLIFTPLKSIISTDYIGKIIIKAIKNDISIICMHTNLDSAKGGVNDTLAMTLGLKNIQNLGAGDSCALGRFGELEMQFDDFLDIVKQKLNANGLKYTGNKPVKKVAVLGGSGGKLIDFAINNECDTYVTADCSYDVFQKAKVLGINLIDAGHFATENVITGKICSEINEKFNNIAKVSKTHTDVINFK